MILMILKDGFEETEAIATWDFIKNQDLKSLPIWTKRKYVQIKRQNFRDFAKSLIILKSIISMKTAGIKYT